MTELSKTVEGETEVEVTERGVHVEVVGCADTDFELVLCSIVSPNLPVSGSISYRGISKNRSEDVLRLL